MKLLQLFLAFCIFASLACNDIDSITFDSEVLTVTVTTVGENLDADGYTLVITGMAEEPIGLNESKSFSTILNTVTVELLGVADNCVVGNNPQTVNLTGPTTVTFVVDCS